MYVEEKNVEKIYSRKRFVEKKTLKLAILLVIIVLLLWLTSRYFEPIFATKCEDKVKSVATIITNQQSTEVMNKYQYDELYTIEKDENGDVLVIQSNVVPVNNMISDLTESIQHEFDNLEDSQIYISLGSLSGIYFFSGMGPDIPVNVSITGNVSAELKSEFLSQGINQTLHRVYVNFECEMRIVSPLNGYKYGITNQVVVAEHVIVGNIPGSYYDLNKIIPETK